ncbi:M23 family metallopeptidase [Pacificimonas aurantium]|uniref:M23 family metallopeptidase n=1 Tax=Pacificimonas aurantium TaxID=1250540 RepID=A0ABS7WMS2_9SPHN|nr:M23 family metallopeptidase [Pacificimonas aurantium]MBZ6379709.1 M23 family metallopeptidase [Pacificimonas aurantium]
MDRELYMRTDGELRFLRISARFQKTVAASTAILLLGWLVLSGNLLASQISMLAERSSVAAMLADAQRTYRGAVRRQKSAEALANDLEARQRALEAVAAEHFDLPGASLTAPSAAVSTNRQNSPEARLKTLEQRQTAFIRQVDLLASARMRRAERTMASLGLDPIKLAGSGEGTGGPYVPGIGVGDDLLRLAETIEKLERLERALLSIPSFMPAEGGRLSSGYGLRRDPFHRRAAMHQGQDFSGPHRSDIRAAAAGTVIRSGWWGGYGRIVIVDHGRGIRTRYAHLAETSVRRGDTVARGETIGAMGSTGRSTGTHLHFEVRIDGKPVNPRPFLEASDHVLEIQDRAGERRQEQADAG